MKIALPAIALGCLWFIQGVPVAVPKSESPALACDHPRVADGDTLRCGGERVRLLGIDAPEMPGSCRPGRRCVAGDPYAAKDYLISITRTSVSCVAEGRDDYDRVLARCQANGADLSCAMLDAGHAERRYSAISCP